MPNTGVVSSVTVLGVVNTAQINKFPALAASHKPKCVAVVQATVALGNVNAPKFEVLPLASAADQVESDGAHATRA